MASRAATARPHLRLVSPQGSAAPRVARSGRGRQPSPRRTGSSPAARAAAARRSATLVLLPTAFLTVVGLVMVLSASSVSAYWRYGSSFLFFWRQVAYALIGTAALVLTARMRHQAWQRLSLPLLGLSVILLLLVLHPSAGTVAGGAARWITVGPMTVQPSELAKLGLVSFAATILARKRARLHELSHVALPLLPAGVIVCGLVILQPDLGTTLILAGSVFLLLFVAGVRFRYLVPAGLVGGGLGAALILGEGYRRTRLLSFLDPWADAGNSGYQLIQSLIALGSGGWFGVGLGASRQKWMYVPNAHTDFIFSILGEELGLLGALVVLLAFAVLIYGGVRIAARAPDPFGQLLAAGVVSWLGLQAVVNLGAVTGLLPITGVPLPLVSFGGSSLIVSLAAIGVLVSIARSTAGPASGSARRARRAPAKARQQAGGRPR